VYIPIQDLRLERSNLKLRSGAQVLKVLIDDNATAYGVEYLKDAKRVKVNSRHHFLISSSSYCLGLPPAHSSLIMAHRSKPPWR
jgi:hypothetical protein